MRGELYFGRGERLFLSALKFVMFKSFSCDVLEIIFRNYALGEVGTRGGS